MVVTAADQLAAQPVPDPPAALPRDLQVDKFLLNGKNIDIRVEQAITEARVTRTITGASTLEVTLHDPRLALLQSGIFNKRVVVKVDQFAFYLVKVGKQGETLQLTFEDLEVALLRRNKKPRKAVRGRVTRAQFILMMAREIHSPRIRVFIPELAEKQPIKKSSERITPTQREQNLEPGLDAGAPITVKGRPATREQKQNIERVLDVGRSMGASRKVLIASIMTIIQESTAQNLRGGDRDSVGLFQQRPSQGWPASRNVERDARAFFQQAIRIDRQSPNIRHTELAQAVQRSAFPNAYDRWRSEAAVAVNEYGGGGLGGGGGASASVQEVRVKQYEFRRGQPGKKESSWEAMQRLAEEVRWRCFVTNGRLYFVSDDHLHAQKPRARITPDTDGILSVDFDHDMGKKVAAARIEARVDRWDVRPGNTLALNGYGPANGRYLVESVERSLFSSTATIQLTKPQPSLPEPAPETEMIERPTSGPSAGTGGPAAVTASGSRRVRACGGSPTRGGTGGNWGGSKERCEHLASLTDLCASSTKRSTQRTASGGVSDHWIGSVNSYAIDLPCTGSRGDRNAKIIARALNRPDWSGGSWLSVTIGGYRYQVGWRVSGHFDHIHIGVKRV